MPNFAYILKDAKGARIEGIMKAESLDQAVDKLAKEGSTIISVKAAADGAFKGRLSLSDKIMLSIYKWRTGVSLKTLVFFTRQLSTMFSAVLTIEKSISDLEKAEKNKKFAKVLRQLSDDIRKGYSLSEAMEQHPGVFNPLYIALVTAGEVSGTLHTILDELSDYLEKIEDTRRKVRSAMAYPLFIVVSSPWSSGSSSTTVVPCLPKSMRRRRPQCPQKLPSASVISSQTTPSLPSSCSWGWWWLSSSISTDRALRLGYIKTQNGLWCDHKLHHEQIFRTFSILMTGRAHHNTMELTMWCKCGDQGGIRRARVMVKVTAWQTPSAAPAFPPTLHPNDRHRRNRVWTNCWAKPPNSINWWMPSSNASLRSSTFVIILMAGVVGGIIIVVTCPSSAWEKP